eukprot:TRINITY_DN14847_c0_g1_i1.p1 TRINITY_DN14847_c0_g1~~TRINITY_DN14847_c0_g1_i1.p1  ORF type:complete len:536 (+),score=99.16 TRINITY_DN14847_c0_g1_i1:34-1641(+)
MIRSILHNVLLLVGVFFLASAWVQWIRNYNTPILIIGAGMSGLSAGRELEQHGYRVHILEARDRIGGRIHTNRELGYPIELGAAFIHKPDQNPVTQLAEQYSFKTNEFDYRLGTYHRSNGTAIPAATRDREHSFFREILDEGFFEERESFKLETWDQPMSTTLELMDFYDDLSVEEQHIFDTFCFQYIVQDLQADLTDVSTKEYDQSFEFGGKEGIDLFSVSGYDEILKGLLPSNKSKLELKTAVDSVRYQWFSQLTEEVMDAAAEEFSQTVADGFYKVLSLLESLAWSHQSVEVTTSNGQTYTSGKVIITLPIGCLKKKRVSFDPPLPLEIRTVVQDLGVSSTLKLGMCWKPEDIFWQKSSNSSLYFHKYPSNGDGKFGRGEFIEIINLVEAAGTPCLLAEVETEFAAKLAKAGKDAAVKRVMEDINQMFPNAVPPSHGVIMSDWADSVFSDGGLVHWTVDTTVQDAEVWTFDVARQLYWAGEHTIWQYYGNTHGAHLSGIRAALHVHYSFMESGGTLLLFTLGIALLIVRNFR